MTHVWNNLYIQCIVWNLDCIGLYDYFCTWFCFFINMLINIGNRWTKEIWNRIILSYDLSPWYNVLYPDLIWFRSYMLFMKESKSRFKIVFWWSLLCIVNFICWCILVDGVKTTTGFFMNSVLSSVFIHLEPMSIPFQTFFVTSEICLEILFGISFQKVSCNSH